MKKTFSLLLSFSRQIRSGLRDDPLCESFSMSANEIIRSSERVATVREDALREPAARWQKNRGHSRLGNSAGRTGSVQVDLDSSVRRAGFYKTSEAVPFTLIF